MTSYLSWLKEMHVPEHCQRYCIGRRSGICSNSDKDTFKSIRNTVLWKPELSEKEDYVITVPLVISLVYISLITIINRTFLMFVILFL